MNSLKSEEPPKNGEIALLLGTNRGCVVKYVSQKWNDSNNKYQQYNILVIFKIQFYKLIRLNKF